MSGARHRRKGDRLEREIVEAHRAFGVHAERYPLSGANRFRGSGHDIDIYAFGREAAPLVSRRTALSAFMPETDVSDVRRDAERLGKGAVEFRGAYRAQALQLQQGLEYLRDLNPADVSTVASMQAGGEVQVMVVGPTRPEFLRCVQHTWVEHG